MIAKRLVLAALLTLATAASASAQGNPTGTMSGRVLSDAGALPGVTVTATSPNLQGSRARPSRRKTATTSCRCCRRAPTR